ncbi:unnamed protein product, partial [marine sediment metagenome]
MQKELIKNSEKINWEPKYIKKGENWRDIKKRLVDFIKDIRKSHKNKIILIVSHADPLWLLAGFLKGLSEDELLEKGHIER